MYCINTNTPILTIPTSLGPLWPQPPSAKSVRVSQIGSHSQRNIDHMKHCFSQGKIQECFNCSIEQGLSNLGTRVLKSRASLESDSGKWQKGSKTGGPSYTFTVEKCLHWPSSSTERWKERRSASKYKLNRITLQNMIFFTVITYAPLWRI